MENLPSLSDLSWAQIAGASIGGAVGLIGLMWLAKRPSALYEIKSSIVIDASAQRVFDTLTNYEEIPKWSSFIKSIKGSKKVGEHLEVDLLLPGESSTWKFTPKLLKFVPGSEFRWKGSLPIPFMYNGEHYFIITPLSDNQCRLEHGESFDGFLVPFLTGTNKLALKGFENFNAAIKARSEAK